MDAITTTNALAGGLVFVIAFVFSMLDPGGGMLYVPLFKWLEPAFTTVAIPLSLLLNEVTTLSAFARYAREGLLAVAEKAVTLVEKASNRALRISYKPTLQPRIAESAFMKKRGMGIGPDEIPEAEQMEMVDLVWNAPEADIMTIGEVFEWDEDWLPEVMGFVKCNACGELAAKAYLRVVGDKHVCIPCSGYDH